jgi:Tfp pilus assembly protein PilN
MRAVNLLPAPRVEKRQDDVQSRARTSKAIAIAAGLVLVLLAIVLGYAFSNGRSQVSDRQAKLDNLQAEVSQAQAAAAVPSAARSTTQAHLAAVTSAASGRIAWDALLAQLSRVMPAGSWLESLQASNGSASSSSTTSSPTTSSTTSSSTSTTSTSTTGAAPTGFVLTGYALSQDIVALALDRLALMPGLSDVSLQSTTRADVGNKKPVQFTIGANVRSAGGNG